MGRPARGRGKWADGGRRELRPARAPGRRGQAAARHWGEAGEPWPPSMAGRDPEMARVTPRPGEREPGTLEATVAW